MPRVPSNRLPVIITQRVYARATIYAEAEGMTLEEFTEAALIEAGQRTEARMQEAEFAAACAEARATRKPNPTRQDYFGERGPSRRGVAAPAAIFGTSEAVPGMRCTKGTPAQPRTPTASLARKSEPGGPGGGGERPRKVQPARGSGD